MCRKVVCKTCNKATWAGCGMHIDSALAGVAEGERCTGWRTGKCGAFVPSGKDSSSNGSCQLS